MSKRKRKGIVSFEASKIEELYEYDNRDFDTRMFSHIFSACGADSPDYKTYDAVITTEKYGRSVLLFTPNEKFLLAMKPYLSRQIVVNLFYKRYPGFSASGDGILWFFSTKHSRLLCVIPHLKIGKFVCLNKISYSSYAILTDKTAIFYW